MASRPTVSIRDYAVGFDRKLYRSTDSGNSWDSVK
jgi:hypothetical protein